MVTYKKLWLSGLNYENQGDNSHGTDEIISLEFTYLRIQMWSSGLKEV